MKTIALLIDGDNAQLSSTKQILRFCEAIGTLKRKNAYGDWENLPLSAHHQTIKKLGVECVQQNRVVPNATDFALSMAAAVMLDKKEADIYVIVSSDNHFTVVYEHVRQKGAVVYGIGSKNQASVKLRKACNRFYNVEDILENQSKASTKYSTALVSAPPPKKSKSTAKTTSAPKSTPKAKPALAPKAKAQIPPKSVPKSTAKAKPAPKPTSITKVKVKPTDKDILQILINAYKQAPPQNDGWVLLAHLGNMLGKLDDTMKKRLASKKLSTWIKAFQQNFIIKGDRVRMI